MALGSDLLGVREGSPALVHAAGVAKAFGATRALVDGTLRLEPGEVHTIMGENGSGKSTLVKILAGVHRPDSGELLVAGEAWATTRSPAAARRRGVGAVFQEVLTVPGRSIVDNVWLGSPRREADADERRERAADVLESLLGRRLDVSRPIGGLSLSERQACCIARALVAEPRLLILDESTSALDVATRDRLFETVKEVAAQGCGVLFVSHRMDEVFAISDVVTVLRSGSTVSSRLPIAGTSVGDVVRLMSVESSSARTGRGARTAGKPVLRAEGIRLAPTTKPIDLELREGEVVGLAGLEGQGQDNFLRVLSGAPPAAGRVVRVTDTGTTAFAGPHAARRLGLAYVPRERRAVGILEPLSIWENFGMPTFNRDTVVGVLRPHRTARRMALYRERLRIKFRRHTDSIGSLSGGNQQKVVVARALADEPAIVLLNDPTRGIDLGAKHDLYEVLEELCAHGTALVLLSTEVDELIELPDRVLVFRENELVADIPHDQVTRESVVAAYFGEYAGPGSLGGPPAAAPTSTDAPTGA